MPKAVYCSSCRNEQNRLQCDSNLGPVSHRNQLSQDLLTTVTVYNTMTVVHHRGRILCSAQKNSRDHWTAFKTCSACFAV